MKSLREEADQSSPPSICLTIHSFRRMERENQGRPPLDVDRRPVPPCHRFSASFHYPQCQNCIKSASSPQHLLILTHDESYPSATPTRSSGPTRPPTCCLSSLLSVSIRVFVSSPTSNNFDLSGQSLKRQTGLNWCFSRSISC